MKLIPFEPELLTFAETEVMGSNWHLAGIPKWVQLMPNIQATFTWLSRSSYSFVNWSSKFRPLNPSLACSWTTQSCNALQVIPCQVGFGTVPGHGLEPSKPALTVKTALTIEESWTMDRRSSKTQGNVTTKVYLLSLVRRLDFAIFLYCVSERR